MRRRRFIALSLGVALVALLLAGAWALAKSRRYQLFFSPVYHVETERRVVALTFTLHELLNR